MLEALGMVFFIGCCAFMVLCFGYMMASCFNRNILNQEQMDALVELSSDEIPFDPEDLPEETEDCGPKG